MTCFSLDRMSSLRRWAAALALGAPASAGASSGSDSLLGGDIGNAVFTLVIFLVLVAVLGKFAWKPLLTVLREREQTIRDSLETARRERDEAAQLLARHQKQLDQARAEAAAVVEEGRRDAEAARRRIQEEARAEAEVLLARARREIRLATDAAVTELYDQTAELSVRIAAGIIRKELSPDDHRRLVNESLQQMKSADPTGRN